MHAELRKRYHPALRLAYRDAGSLNKSLNRKVRGGAIAVHGGEYQVVERTTARRLEFHQQIFQIVSKTGVRESVFQGGPECFRHMLQGNFLMSIVDPEHDDDAKTVARKITRIEL